MLEILSKLLFGAHENPDFYRTHASRTAIAPFEDSNSIVKRAVMNLEREALGWAYLKRTLVLLLCGAMGLWLVTHLSLEAARWLSDQWTEWRARAVERQVDEAMSASRQRVEAARAKLKTQIDVLEELRMELRR